ncbi:MAG: hypothetical protein AB8G22_16470, partial [Saprospiraceae bacterium]
MSELAQFYILAHTFISFIGGTLLLAIWYNITKRFRQRLVEDDSQKRVDKGLLHLSSAMFVWVISGLWMYFGYESRASNSYQIVVSLLSVLNNLFLLLALFYFYYAPPFIYHNQKNVNKIILLIIATTGITILLPAILGEQNIWQQIRISSVPDFILSAFLSGMLAIALYRTFLNTNLKVVAWISVVAIVLMLLSQLPEVFLQLDDQFTPFLLKIIAKTALIAIFLVLATTWVIRLASTPQPNEMSIRFLDWSIVKINIPSKGIEQQVVDFGSKATQYKNLLKFSVRRKFGEHIPPAITVGGYGEIPSQTYLSRIIENINSILQLDSHQKLERRDLFTFIGNGQYRLRIPAKQIQIDDA